MFCNELIYTAKWLRFIYVIEMYKLFTTCLIILNKMKSFNENFNFIMIVTNNIIFLSCI